MAGKTVIRELVTRWGFDIDKEHLDAADNAVASLKKGLVVATAATVAFVGASAMLVQKTANQVDITGKLAQGYGITAQSVAELTHAFGLAGLSQNEVSKSFKKLASNTFEATFQNKKMQESFALLGIDVDKFAKTPIDKRLEVLADALAGIEDPSTRAALRITLLGKAGAEMGPLLDKGSASLKAARAEARALGVNLTELDVKNAEKMNDDIARLKLGFKAFTTQLALDAMPMVIEFTGFLQDTFNEYRPQITKAIKVTKEWVAEMGGVRQMVRVLGIVIAIAFGAKAIAVLRTFLISLKGIKLAFIAIRTQAILANIAAFLIPVAIAALIVLIGLLIEDWDKFTKGQKSSIGELLKKYPGLKYAIIGIKGAIIAAKMAGELMGKAMGWVVFQMMDAWYNFSARFKVLWKTFPIVMGQAILLMRKTFFNFVGDVFAKFNGLIAKLGETASLIPGVEIEAIKKVSLSLSGFEESARGLANNTALPSGLGASDTKANGKTRTSITVKNETNNTIVQKPGESNDDLAKRIDANQRKAEDRLARKIDNDIAAAHAY